MKVIVNKAYKASSSGRREAFLLTPDLHEKLIATSDLIKAPNDITALAYAIELTLQLVLAMDGKETLTVTIQNPQWRKNKND